MAFPYSFRRGRAQGLGIGAEGYGLERPSTLPRCDGWQRPRYMVRGALDPQAPGFVKEGQQLVPASLVGNGLYSSGQLELQKLAQLTGGK